MASYIRVAGPQQIYVIAGGTTCYLGTTEIAPTFEERPRYIGILNAIAGQSLPMQEFYQGTDLVVNCLFTRYDEAVATLIRTAPRSSTMGLETGLSRGTGAYGNSTFQLVIVNQFYGTVNAVPGDLPGYLFYYAKYEGGTPSPNGTVGNKYGMVFTCSSVYNSTTRGFDLFTNTLPNLPTPS